MNFNYINEQYEMPNQVSLYRRIFIIPYYHNLLHSHRIVKYYCVKHSLYRAPMRMIGNLIVTRDMQEKGYERIKGDKYFFMLVSGSFAPEMTIRFRLTQDY